MGMIVHKIMNASAVKVGKNSVNLFEVCMSKTVHTIIANNNETFENKEIEYVFLVVTSFIVNGTAPIELMQAPMEIKIYNQSAVEVVEPLRILKYKVIDKAIDASNVKIIVEIIILLFLKLNFIFSFEEFNLVFLIFIHKTKITVKKEIIFAKISGIHRRISIVILEECAPVIS
jgi:hypothetical protein